MLSFSNIIGHEEIITHLKNAMDTGKVSHSYIFVGEHGSGKKMLAAAFAASLQCEKGGSDPCGVCDSCKRAIGRNHPDIIWIQHEKPGSISVDEVRAQLVADVEIKPYFGKRKIYVIPDAELMTPQAQNAILKTVEEPPEYVVILLLTCNADCLLQTIRSRCVRLDLKMVEDGLVKKYLMEHLGIPDYEAELDVSYAQGNVGKAIEAASSQEFANLTRSALTILEAADRMEIYEISDEIKRLSQEKQSIEDYLDIFLFWFRDVLMFKATREIDNLVFKDRINEIKKQASMRSYENIEKILESINRTKIRLKANVNLDVAMELLFLTIRER